MVSRWVATLVAFFVVFTSALAAEPALLGNGTFEESGLSTAQPKDDGSLDSGRSWLFFLNSGAQATAVIDNGQLKVTPEKINAPAYGIQLLQSPVLIEKGADYELSFDAKSTTSRPLSLKVGGTASRKWAAYSGEQKVNIKADWARYTVKFSMSAPTDRAARVEFWFTDALAPVWLDNVKLIKTTQADVAPAPISGPKTKLDEDKLTQWKMVWSDEFDKGTIDASHWSFEKGNNGGWGNNELEVYTDKAANASIQTVDGASSLAITARKESVQDGSRTFDYTSARMITKGKFTMKAGKLEIRAKLPKGQGIWPALWLLGDNIDSVSWPRCGEIDLMELLGHQPGKIYSTIHGPISGGPGIGQSYTLPDGKSFADDFHVFTFEWRPEHLEFLVDGHLFSVADKAKVQYEVGASDWVYDHPFFLILNVAVGGGWPGNPNSSTSFPQTMAVDYIRVYENTGSELGPGEMEWIP